MYDSSRHCDRRNRLPMMRTRCSDQTHRKEEKTHISVFPRRGEHKTPIYSMPIHACQCNTNRRTCCWSIHGNRLLSTSFTSYSTSQGEQHIQRRRIQRIFRRVFASSTPRKRLHMLSVLCPEILSIRAIYASNNSRIARSLSSLWRGL